MAENIPPPTSSADATRGVPYYEKLKRDLRETLQKKRLLDKNLVRPTLFQIQRYQKPAIRRRAYHGASQH